MAYPVVTADRSRARHGREVKALRHAWREFGVNRSPRLIASGAAVMAAARLLLGGFSWRDAVAVAAMLIVYPFGEWAIHVYLLHLRPFRLGARRVDLPTARAHREHHEQPNDLGLVLLGPAEAAALLLLAVPLTPAVAGALIAALAQPVPFGALVTATLTGYALVGAYEWTHFLIHTGYQPRSHYYRSIWRAHRLHHFKNERYWHGVTNTVSDRVLGTFPHQRDVRRSYTARTLDPGSRSSTPSG
jgi:sterol desaturase/sphingolipid hydroxylase (fatty acid hydroxylase superfamily)